VKNRRRLEASLVFTAVVAITPARADEGQEAAAAEALFQEGRALLALGKLPEACEKFGQSKRLDPAPGTLLNLGRCYEELGRTASAWATYRELTQRATKLGQTARAEFASQKAAELERSLATLVVDVPTTHRIASLSVEYDGTPLGIGAWGARLPVDPGPHHISARAPGRLSWSRTVDVRASEPASVEIPLLAPSDTPTRPDPLETVAIWTTVGGPAAVVTGVVFRGAAKTENEAAEDACVGLLCSPTGVTRRGLAHDFTTVSTVVTITGAALVVAGLATWLLARRVPRAGVATILGGMTF
jgi:serine/threonine-protein kinase